MKSTERAYPSRVIRVVAAHTGAGVRKPPMEETAGGLACSASDAAGIWL
jgi:hypothetical protein